MDGNSKYVQLFVILLFSYVKVCQSNHKLFTDDLQNIGVLEAIQEVTYLENGSCSICDESVSLTPIEDASNYTKVYLFTRQTGDNYSEIIFGNLTSVQESAFDLSKITKVLVHGWLAGAFQSYEEEIKDAYLSAQDVNVLCVDWSQMADNVVYLIPVTAVVPVGEYVAKFLDWLVTDAGVDLGSLHIVGHSLGAQIAGVIGEHMTVGNISRITGLDPAGPGFTNASTSGRLDPSDAEFVDVIHTCGHFAGFFSSCGHVDFYPHKGEAVQPGCNIPVLVCSHIRSHDLFNESISRQEFIATPCDSWEDYISGVCDGNATVVMGEHVDTSARGVYYLHTAGSYPYGLGNDTALTNDEL